MSKSTVTAATWTRCCRNVEVATVQYDYCSCREKWYSKLLDLTFRTAFVPLEPAEVLSILRVHKSIISRDSFLYKKHVDESELRDIQVPESDSVSSTLHEKLNLTVIIGHLAKPREEDTSRDGQNGRERRSFY